MLSKECNASAAYVPSVTVHVHKIVFEHTLSPSPSSRIMCAVESGTSLMRNSMTPSALSDGELAIARNAGLLSPTYEW